MSADRVLRKYANRRLYDATESRHVTLEDIRKLIAAGERVKIVDDKTGEDITRSILLQIIANQEQFGKPVLSTVVLEAIIRFYGNPVQEMLTSYLERTLGGLLRQQQLMQAEMAKALETPMQPLTELTRRNMEIWSKMQATLLSTFTPQAQPERSGGNPTRSEGNPTKRQRRDVGQPERSGENPTRSEGNPTKRQRRDVGQPASSGRRPSKRRSNKRRP